MPHPDAEKWNTIYHDGGHDHNRPVRVLKEYAHLLPEKGTALDLACGRGANALFLAQYGLETFAWDISEVAIDELKIKANQLNLSVNAEVRDIVEQPPSPDSFDVIIVSYFLDRTITPAITSALKKNGLLFYQTFIRERIDDTGPRNNDYRLGENELLHLCSGLRIVVYREEGKIGNINQGLRNEALLIGQRC